MSSGRKRKKVEEALSENSERDMTIRKYFKIETHSFDIKERPVAVQERGGEHDHLGGVEGKLFPATRKPSSTGLSRADSTV